MKKHAMILALALVCFIGCLVFADDEADFYKGNYAPDGDYILNGGLIKDLPGEIEFPVDYKAPGFAADRLSKVPAPGIHPRVIISPSDIERMKKTMAMGEKAPRFFRMMIEGMRQDVNWKVPANHNYSASPWGEDSKIAGWALYALLTDDQELGRKAAKETVKHALYVEPWADLMNSMPETAPIKDVAYDFIRMGLQFGAFDYKTAYYQGGKEKVMELYKKHGVTLSSNSPTPGCLTLGWEYDYAYNFMTDDERDIVRRVISKITYGKFTTGMALPGQMFINNHMSGSANQIPLALAIEGEEGFDERIIPMGIWSINNKLTYDLSSDGITYENTKGFIPMLPVVALARRQGPDDPELLLKHSHLLARANSNVQHARKLYNRYITRHRGRPGTKPLDKIVRGFDEGRYWRASGASGSGGHVEFWNVLKYFYPENEMVDFVWNTKNSDFNAEMFEGKEGERFRGLHHAWFGLKALSLLTMTYDTDYNKLDELKMFDDVQKFWFDSERGIMSMRNDWSADSMLVHMENRTDQYYMGHETPQHGDFQVWADGIPWCPNVGAYRDTSYRAMVTVDGLAGVYAPVSGDWMTADNSKLAGNSVAEMTTAYQWRKSMNGLRHLDHPGLDQMPSQMGRFVQQAYALNRYTELPYLPKIREHYDGYGHLDYGPWHGESRGPERYIKWNDPMDHVFRTIHFARGDKPYLLIFDDLEKDGKKHQFDWRMPVVGDSVVYELNPAPQNRHIEMNTVGAIGTDIILAMKDDNLKRGTGSAWGGVYPILKPAPKAGDPMLLIRVLWRNTNYPYPTPNVQRYWGYNMVSIPAYSESPEYRVMIFPYRYGDKLPTTQWSDDRSELTVKIDGVVDKYQIGQADRKRTVYAMYRDGQKVIDSKSTPASPVLIENGKWTIDQNRPEWRQKRIVIEPAQVNFETVTPGAAIYYTLDGSEPTEKSTLYTRTITIDKTVTLKARTYQPYWNFGDDNFSDIATFEFEKKVPVKAGAPANTVPGLIAKGYEIKTTLFDKKGFFQGSKNALPDISKYEPLVSTVTDGFDIPAMEAKQSVKRMMKGFYSFDGFYNAPATGVYYFEVQSCGPVDFTVSGQQVILIDKQYGLSYKKRYGEVALEKGTHKLSLVVCDPVFWKGDMEEVYTINVAVKVPGTDSYAAIDASDISCDAPFTLAGTFEDVKPLAVEVVTAKEGLSFKYSLTKLTDDNDKPAKMKKLSKSKRTIKVDEPGQYSLTVAAFDGRKQVGTEVTRQLMMHEQFTGAREKVVAGVLQHKYDRTGFFAKFEKNPNSMSAADDMPEDGLPLSYFNTAKAEPFASGIVDKMTLNDSPKKLIAYQGLLRIAKEGVYEFKLPKSRENCAQLMINGQAVVRQQVDAPKAPGKIWLSSGLHRFELAVALGQSQIAMKHADESQFQNVSMAAIAVPVTAEVLVDGKTEMANIKEIFTPAEITLASPIKGARVLYSLNGKKPKTAYNKAINIDKSCVLNTQLVANGKAVGGQRSIKFSLNEVPMAGLLAYLNCESLKDGVTPLLNGRGAKAVVVGAQIVEGKNGNALGMYGPKARIIVRDLKAAQDAASISCWVKFKDKHYDVGIWHKVDNTWPEHYVFLLRGTRLVAEWQRRIGTVEAHLDKDDVAPGKWVHIAATFGKENSIYLNGELLKTVAALNMSKRSSNGLSDNGQLMTCNNEPTAVDDYRIYDRVLSPVEIKAIYDAEK